MRNTSLTNRKANKFGLQPMPSFTRRMPAGVVVEDFDSTGYSALLEEYELDRLAKEWDDILLVPEWNGDPLTLPDLETVELEPIDTRPLLPKGPWNKVLLCGHQVREKCGGCGQYRDQEA